VNTSFNLFWGAAGGQAERRGAQLFLFRIDALVIDKFVLSKSPAKILPASAGFSKAS
jgi:hypothetical protein